MTLEELRKIAEAATPVSPLPSTARPIPGYGGYWADEYGNIWNLLSKWRGYGPRQMSADVDRYGYLKVRLRCGDRRHKKAVHYLVNLAWNGAKPTEHHETRHINGVRTDNRPMNLCWGTRKENAADRTKHGHCRAAENGRMSAPRRIQEVCKRGHKYSVSNSGKKWCKECDCARKKARNR